jgi:hypothetical protein
MKSRRLHIVLAAALLIGAASVRADSIPVVRGGVSGVELCAQSMCGAAVFVALFNGQVGGNPHALGIVSVAITHDDLPLPNENARIRGGLWQIQLLGRTIRGRATGGVLHNNDGNGTFGVHVDMEITSGGTGTLNFDGVLSHNVFPPSIIGVISQ